MVFSFIFPALYLEQHADARQVLAVLLQWHPKAANLVVIWLQMRDIRQMHDLSA